MKLDEKNLSLKIRAKTFYFASLLLPKKLRSEIETLYVFCRLIDDLVDNNKFKKKYILKSIKKIKNDIKKKKSSDRRIESFIKLMKKYKIEKELPFILIEGVEEDLKNVNIKNLNELIEYSFKVAGTVGFMFCRIIGVREKKQIFRGLQLGIAMQFTNIARDVEEDLERKRIYIPKSMRCYKKNNHKFILKNENIKKKFSKDLKSFLNKADEIYFNAWRGIYKLPLKFKLPVAIAAELYQQIGKKIKKKEYKVWGQRVYLSKIEKILFSLKAIRKTIFFIDSKPKNDIDDQIKSILKNLNFNFYE